MKNTVFLYLIRAKGTNLIKIGINHNPEKRLRHLQTACPEALRLFAQWPGSLDIEADIHRPLHQYRRAGEWFELAPEDAFKLIERRLLLVRPMEEWPDSLREALGAIIWPTWLKSKPTLVLILILERKDASSRPLRACGTSRKAIYPLTWPCKRNWRSSEQLPFSC